MIVKLDADILYWRETDKAWTSGEYISSKYDTRAEAESKALLLASNQPDMIGKLHVKDFYANGFESYEQGEIF